MWVGGADTGAVTNMGAMFGATVAAAKLALPATVARYENAAGGMVVSCDMAVALVNEVVCGCTASGALT